MTPTVYLAAGPKQTGAAMRLRIALEKAVPGLQILDWAGQAWTEAHAARVCAVSRPASTMAYAKRFFTFCADACLSADLVICLEHTSQAAGIQAGMAYAAGTPVLGIRGRHAPSSMMKACVAHWVDTMADALPLVIRLQHCLSHIETAFPEEGNMPCINCDLHSLCRYFSLLAEEDKRKVSQ